MVLGGVNGGYDVELIDLTGQGRTCQKPDNYPALPLGSAGAYFEEKVFVCGGFLATSVCYSYNQHGRSWTLAPSMTEGRQYFTATIFNDQLWLTGGYKSGQELASTELFNSNSNEFDSFVNLPVGRAYHNVISIENNKAMLLGGRFSYQDTHIYDGTSWQNGPTLLRARGESQAGLVTFENGTKIIVAAGGLDEQTTEIFNIDANEWQAGPDLPYLIKRGASVQFENTFLIVGGKDTNSDELDTIWKFDMDTENWALLDVKMQAARSLTAAFLVPEDFCQ